MHRLKHLLIVTLAGLIGFVAACDNSKKTEKSDKDEQTSEEKAKAESAKKDNKKDDKDKGNDKPLPFEATGPVAVVDGTEISAGQFNELVRKMADRMRRQIPPQMVDRFKTKTLQRTIDTHLIEQEIEKSGITVSDEELKAEFDNFKKRFPDDKAFQSFLKMRGLSEPEIKDDMRKELSLRKLLKKRKGIEVTEKDAKKFYEENPSEFEKKERVKASHILINAKKGADEKKLKEARKKAEELAEKAKKEGADFEKLAKKHSEGPSARNGGDLGFFSREQMVPAFSKEVFGLKNGEVSDPVQTRFGFHVIKRFDYKDAEKTSFEDAKSDIVRRLEQKKVREALDGFLSELKKDADIKKKPENIKVNVDTSAKPGGMGMGKGGGKRINLQQLKKQLQKQQQAQQKGGDEKGGSEQGK